MSAMENNKSYLECEKKWIFAALMFVAGFYGAFTYSIRGGVFCNAQTGNFVFFSLAVGKGEFAEAMYYLIPMGAYLLGTIISEALPKPIKKLKLMRWDTLLILIEIIVVAFLGFLPESAPYQISQIAINFICSMQYNTFRQAQGVSMATTFCTNHIRQVGVWMVKAFTSRDKNSLGRMLHHILMLVCFVLGGILSTALCSVMQGRAIWIALIPLAVVFSDLLYADLHTEKDKMNLKPRGH